MKTKIKQAELYSFDIFDTLITRRVGTPRGIFALMQESLKEKIRLNKDFYTVRIESERLARDAEIGKEASFDGIYQRMQADYDLSDEEVRFLKDLEIKTELENLRGIDENISRVKNLVEQGERVVLISDMYYDSDTIRMFLSHIDPVFEKIKIYVSSEYKATKWTGELFKIVQEKENITPQKWIHFGDNINSDVKKAKNLGIKAKHFEFPPLMEYEKELLGMFPDNTDYQKLVGASRLARLNKSENKNKYDFGASFTAPVLYNYVNWILEESLKKGFKTLHFIARDGYIPKIVADMVIKKRGLDIKTKYIYGSRLAWRVPSKDNWEEFITHTLNDCYQRLSVKFLAYRLHMDLEELNSYLKVKNVKKLLSVKESLKIKDTVLNSTQIRDAILKANEERRKLLIDYLKQELDFSDPSLAFVEINGSGKTQDILHDYINQIMPRSIHTFYLAGNFLNSRDSGSIKQVYCTKPKPHYHYLELLFRAPEGQTINYKYLDNKVIPVQENFPVDKLKDWGFDSYLAGIIDYTQEILKKNEYKQSVDFCYEYHDHLTLRCDFNTADILGDIPFSTVGEETNVQKIAPVLKLYQFLFLILSGKDIHTISEFPDISLARSQRYYKDFMNILLSHKFIINFLAEVRLYKLLKSLSNKKVILWGASIFLEQFLKKYRINSKNIIGIIDRNPYRAGEKIGDYKIYSPDDIKGLKPDSIVLTIKNSHRYIYSRLLNEYNDFKIEKDVFEFLWIS